MRTRSRAPRRLGVYSDYSYRMDGDSVTAEFPFSRFVEGLAPYFDRVTAIGRLDPGPGRFPYPLTHVSYIPLPHYGSGADLRGVLGALPISLWRFWRALSTLDVVWIMGPTPPQSILFVLLARLRRRRVVLGVRQNLPELIRHRRAGRPAVIAAARTLETVWRTLARWIPVAVVGPDLADRYHRARSICMIYVSLLREGDLLPSSSGERDYDGPHLRLLSVGRLDPEKNPLLLADVLAEALRRDPRWHLDVCGEGTLAGELAERAVTLGVANRMTLHGNVSVDGPLWDFYRRAHALVHVSLTEGVPQVILEAFAARLPVVATAVGGVGPVVSERGWLVSARDAVAAAKALQELLASTQRRRQLVDAAQSLATAHTLNVETATLARFLAGKGATA